MEVVIQASDTPSERWASWDTLGDRKDKDFLASHVEAVLALEGTDTDRIAQRDFRIVVDAVNSVGGIAIPALLRGLGVRDEQIIQLHCEPTGRFAHPAEPLPQNLTEIIERVGQEKADLGLVVDPDADRLALIADGGVYVSERADPGARRRLLVAIPQRAICYKPVIVPSHRGRGGPARRVCLSFGRRRDQCRRAHE